MGLSRSYRQVGILLIALSGGPLAAQTVRDTTPAARIARIAQDIRSRSASGADSGTFKSLADRMAELHVPGVSIAVFNAGKIEWARGFGVRDVASGAPVDSLTLFQAASISKPVSAAGMLRLAEQGRIQLDADVNTMLRSWKVPPSQFADTAHVTLRHIVSHMAGFNVHGFAGYEVGAPLPSLVQILDGLRPANSGPVRLESVPGARESYSGGGVTVMQLLLQDVTGQAFDELMLDLVLRPAGMARSTFAQPLPAQVGGNVATGYRSDGSAVPGRYHVYPEQAAAGLWTTASDLARFMLAVGRSYRGEPEAILEIGTARQMLTKVPRGSGLGFGISGTGMSERYRHSGGNEGYRAFAVGFTGTGRGVVVLTNSDAGTALYQELLNAVSREYGWPRMNVGAP